jgi:hypothetical protein
MRGEGKKREEREKMKKMEENRVRGEKRKEGGGS